MCNVMWWLFLRVNFSYFPHFKGGNQEEMKSFQWLRPCYSAQGQTTNMQCFMAFRFTRTIQEILRLSSCTQSHTSGFIVTSQQSGILSFHPARSEFSSCCHTSPPLYFMPFALLKCFHGKVCHVEGVTY